MNYRDLFKTFRQLINEQDTSTEDCKEENKPCGCVDSGTDITIERVQEFLAKKYGTGVGGMEITYSGRFGKGIEGEPDGVCGSETRHFIMKFQRQKNICADACVGEITFGEMKNDPDFSEKTSKDDKPINLRDAEDDDETSRPSSSLNSGKTTSNSSFSGATSLGQRPVAPKKLTPGVTLVIKSNIASKTPSSRIKDPVLGRDSNFAGFGRNSFTHGAKGKKIRNRANYQDDAYFVNGVDLADELRGQEGISVTGRKTGRQTGHKSVAEVLKNAAQAVYDAVPNRSGLAQLGGASLERCINQKDIDENPKIPCIQGGWGPGLGHHRWGHQNGMEIDVTYYHNPGSQPWTKYNNSNKRLFDMERNAIFTETLLADKRVEAVLVGVNVHKLLVNYANENQTNRSKFSNILKERNKRLAPSGTGHDNHWHIRLHIPSGSPNFTEFERDFLSGVAPSFRRGSVKLKLKSGPHSRRGGARFNNLKGTQANKIRKVFNILYKKELSEIEKMYASFLSYSLGEYTDEEPTKTFNKNKAIGGASSPKTMASLAQIIRYKGTKQAMTDDEIRGILTYTGRTKGSGFGSNAISRTISVKHAARRAAGMRKYPPYRRRKGYSGGKRLGKLKEEEVYNFVSKAFNISKRSTFLWGGHKQTTRDMFKFFSGLERMTSGKSEGEELQWYLANKEQVDKIVKIQKERKHSDYMKLSTIPKFADPDLPDDEQGWGKGGRIGGGEVSHTFVYPKNGKKYVISVYVKKLPAMTGDWETYGILNTVIRKLIEQI